MAVTKILSGLRDTLLTQIHRNLRERGVTGLRQRPLNRCLSSGGTLAARVIRQADVRARQRQLRGVRDNRLGVVLTRLEGRDRVNNLEGRTRRVRITGNRSVEEGLILICR